MKVFSDRWPTVNLSLALVGLGFLIGFIFHIAFAAELQIGEGVFSLHTNNESMSNVLKKISTASGYKIVLKTDIEDVPLSIQLIDVTLHEAIRRIFQQYSHVEIWDDVEKKLELYVWGAKGPPLSISGKQRKFEPTTKTIE